MSRYALVLLVAAAFAGCAANAPQVTRQLSPTALGAVVVLPFGGPHGDLFADRVSYELLNDGALVVPKAKIAEALAARHLTNERFGTQADVARALAVAKALGADTVVIGSVTALPHGETVIDRMRGAMGFKAAAARLQVLRVADGATLTRAAYRSGERFALTAATYHDAAHALVGAIFQ